MRVAYLFIAYNDPQMLELSIAAIDPLRRDIFVHVDKKSDIRAFQLPLTQRATMLTDRRSVHWADVSMLRAIFDLLETAMQTDDYDYFKLMSNADFPVRRIDQFENFLTSSGGRTFYKVRPVMKDFQGRKRLYSHYRMKQRTSMRLLLQRILFLQMFLGPWLVRQPPAGLEYYTGQTWFTIDRKTASWMLDFWHQEVGFQKYFESVYVPEEIVLPTLAVAGAGPERHEQRQLHYIDWSKAKSDRSLAGLRNGRLFGTGRPAVLELADLPKIQASDTFFARKFSSTHSLELLRTIGRDVHGLDVDAILAATSETEARRYLRSGSTGDDSAVSSIGS